MAPMRRFFRPLTMRQTRGEPLQIGGELRRGQALGVQRGQRVGNAVLHQVVAGAHLAAEAVAADGDGHGVGAVGRGLHQHRNLQAGEADGVHNAALFAEVGQGDDDAVDLVGVLLEELGALLRLSVRFHRAMLRFFRAQHDGARAGRLQNCDDLFAAGLGQMIGEESAVAHHYTKCHFALRCHLLAPSILAAFAASLRLPGPEMPSTFRNSHDRERFQLRFAPGRPDAFFSSKFSGVNSPVCAYLLARPGRNLTT